MVIAKGPFSAVASMKQTEALATVIFSFRFSCFSFFFEGELKTELNIQEENLTMDIASVIISFLAWASSHKPAVHK